MKECKRRVRRRTVGMLNARVREVGLDGIADPRGARGKRWDLTELLTAAVVGIAAGAKNLSDVEALTDGLSKGVRRRIGIRRRVPDTTMRDVLVRVGPGELRDCLHTQVRKAYRRKALKPVGLPFGVLALDGKCTAIDTADGVYAQEQRTAGGGTIGLVRTLTASLVSAEAKPCVDAFPVPADTNEMGAFKPAVSDLHKAYGRSELFDLITADAGVCSEANGRAVVEHGWNYLFGLKEPQHTLYHEAVRLLGSLAPDEAQAESEERVGKQLVTRRVYLTGELAGYLDWDHLLTVLRVESEKVDVETGEVTGQESRYFLSSLKPGRLSARGWLRVVRLHWGVENNCHCTWDKVFREDERPWITGDPAGMLVVLLLRRLAYNMLSLFRSVTQRSELRRTTPWRAIIRWVYDTLIAATDEDLAGLRIRLSGAVPALD